MALPMDLYSRAAELTAQRKPFAIATVVRVEGSSSARRGSKALIDAQGSIVMGWVGGGCAESAVRTEALRCMRSEKPELITLDMQDEILGVGMPCGGMMEVYIEPVMPQPELLIVGHGRIAEAIAAIAHQVNFSIAVNDPCARPEAFPSSAVLVTDDIDLSQAKIDRGTFVVIATQHKGDHLWLQNAIG